MKSLSHFLAVSFLAIMLFSCKSTTPTAKDSNDITGKTWKLVEIKGKPIELKNPKSNPHFSLNMVDMRYSGHGGCNGVGGTFEIKPEVMRIKFNQGMSTMMACDDLETERQFTQALLAADNYSVNGNILTLNKAKMAPLAKFILQE